MFKKFGNWIKGVAVPAAASAISGNWGDAAATLWANGRASRVAQLNGRDGGKKPAAVSAMQSKNGTTSVNFANSAYESDIKEKGSNDIMSLLIPVGVGILGFKLLNK